MEYRNLGKSGLKVSALSFGSWITYVNQLTEKTAVSCKTENNDDHCGRQTIIKMIKNFVCLEKSDGL